MQGATDGIGPALIEFGSGVCIHHRFEGSVDIPVIDDVLLVVPEADFETGEIGSAFGCGFDDGRTVDRHAEDIRLELHQEVVVASAAVDFQRLKRCPGVFFHRVQNVAGLIGEGFEGRADDVVLVGAAGQADDRAAGISIPVGSAQAGEGGNDIDPVGVGHFLREVFGVGRGVDQAQLVTQPLNGGAGDEDGTFKGVVDFAAESPGDGGQQAVFGFNRFFAGVHQQEAAGAVGVFGHAGFEAGLTEERRLLVACDPSDRDFAAAEEGGGPEHARRGLDIRQQGHRAFEGFAELFVPFEGLDVEEHRSGRVGVVGRVDTAFRQFPEQPAVDGPEGQFAAFGSFADAFDVVENPQQLGGGEIRVENQPGIVLHVICKARNGLEAIGIGRGPAALPNDGVVNRFAGLAVPHDGGFTLVGDPDGGNIFGSGVDFGHRFGTDGVLGGPDLHRIVFDPTRMRVDLREFVLCDTDNLTVVIE